jgi:hypothetical protein
MTRRNVYRTDQMRIWNATPEFIANTTMHAPEGKIFVVQIIGVEDHPRPRKRRRKKVEPIAVTGQ